MATSCVDLIDYAEFFEIPPDVVLGALLNPDCSGCSDMRPYSRNHRNGISRNISRSLTTLTKKLGIPMCRKEQVALVDPRDCPIKLNHPVVAMGKRVLIATNTYDICYTKVTGCGDDADPDCKDADRIGQVIASNIPDEWDGDMGLVDFVYDTTCSRTDQVLTDPCHDYDCCETADPCPSNCPCIERLAIESWAFELDGSVTIVMAEAHPFVEGDRISLWHDDSGLPFAYKFVEAVDGLSINILGDDIVATDTFNEVSYAHFVATWFKWQLVHPYTETAKLSNWVNKDCTEIKDGFVARVTANFYKMDETAAIEAVSICHCTDCDFCTHCRDCTTLPEYEWTLDNDTGELCFHRKSECSCGKPHYVKVNYIAGYDELPEDLMAAVVLRAFLYQPGIRCGCEDHDRKLEWWAEIDPSTDNMPLANPNAWPYGRTRAGVELGRLLDAHNLQEIREGRDDHTSYGFFTSRKTGVRGMPVIRGFGKYQR